MAAENQIIYALVARGRNVLAEQTENSGNFTTVTRMLLQKIPDDRDARASYEYDAYVFHYLVRDGVTHLCMTEASAGKRLPFDFLEEVANRFARTFSEDARRNAIAFELNGEFAPVLRDLMEYFATSPSADKIGQVQHKIEENKSVMRENIDKILERGEKIELLVQKTDELGHQAFKFEKEARTLKRAMIWKRVRLYLVISFVVAVLVVIAAMLACGGVDFHPRCASKK